MKIVFLEAKNEKSFVLPKSLVSKLPKTVSLFTSAQYTNSVTKIKEQLRNAGIVVNTHKLLHSKHEAQLLGCNVKKIVDDSQAFVYVGDGEFHPKALILRNEKVVYAYNPLSKKTRIFDWKDAEGFERKKKSGLVNFYSSTHVGVLVSTKNGQNRLSRALKLKEVFKDKNFYFLVSETIDFWGLEDFNFLEVFVNTACPRIGLDDSIRLPKPVINLEELDQKEW
ncbi:hypothetical protein GOV05_00710 [Candidatus Woesearchaeota archaeon]|nr:hypothetical protein [Candidatus Woesearchaeota archaeon]